MDKSTGNDAVEIHSMRFFLSEKNVPTHRASYIIYSKRGEWEWILKKWNEMKRKKNWKDLQSGRENRKREKETRPVVYQQCSRKKKSHIYQREKEKWLVGRYRYTGYRFPGPRCATPTTRDIYSFWWCKLTSSTGAALGSGFFFYFVLDP